MLVRWGTGTGRRDGDVMGDIVGGRGIKFCRLGRVEGDGREWLVWEYCR